MTVSRADDGRVHDRHASHEWLGCSVCGCFVITSRCCKHASGWAAGLLRYWLSAGRGGFSLSGHDCPHAELYAMFTSGPHTPIDPIAGVTVTTSPVPNKAGVFAEIKSVNYLQNALNLMAAQDAGAAHGLFVREDGTIVEGQNVNFGIITHEGVVRVPPFTECLAGCTMARLLEILDDAISSGDAELENITGVEQVRTVDIVLVVAASTFSRRGADGMHPNKGGLTVPAAVSLGTHPLAPNHISASNNSPCCRGR